MNFWNLELSCALGVILSVIIPVLRKALVKSFPEIAGTKDARGEYVLNAGPTFTQKIMMQLKAAWPVIKPYFILGIFSLTIAFLLVAFLGENLKTWQSAVIAGYLWDSTLQKIVLK